MEFTGFMAYFERFYRMSLEHVKKKGFEKSLFGVSDNDSYSSHWKKMAFVCSWQDLPSYLIKNTYLITHYEGDVYYSGIKLAIVNL